MSLSYSTLNIHKELSSKLQTYDIPTQRALSLPLDQKAVPNSSKILVSKL